LRDLTICAGELCVEGRILVHAGEVLGLHTGHAGLKVAGEVLLRGQKQTWRQREYGSVFTCCVPSFGAMIAAV